MADQGNTEQPDTTPDSTQDTTQDSMQDSAQDSTQESSDEAMTGVGPDQDAEPPGEDGQSAGTAQRPPADS